MLIPKNTASKEQHWTHFFSMENDSQENIKNCDLSYTGNEVMRKQLTTFSDIDEIIEIIGSLACNSQPEDVC